MNRQPFLFRAAGLVAGLAAALVLGSCGREASLAPGPDGVTLARHARLSFEPVFPRIAGGARLADVVQFEKVHVVLHRADGTVALDTTVLFPVGADSVVLAADVQLASRTGNTGEVFKAELGYLNAAGDVVFKGGPVDLTVVPKGSNTTPPPIQIPVNYSGPGASATRVAASPRSVTVSEGQAFNFAASALDASGNALPGTPIVWAALDPSRAVLNSSLSGSGRALNVRGSARIVAQLLTGPADTVVVNVNLLPKSVTLQGGNGQKGITSTALLAPIAVKVTASDGVGVSGVPVNFAVTTGGGSVGSGTVQTDANGIASTTWTMGPNTGEQTASATVSGLSGSPVNFTATARSVAPVKLSLVSGPAATNAAGAPMSVKVQALDAQDDVAKTFTGTVTLALAPGSTVAPLLGTLSAKAVDGVVSFSDVRINLAGTGYALQASATDLTSVTTNTFAIIPGPATKLQFGSYPFSGFTAGAPQTITVQARDAAGNVATSFNGPISLGLSGAGAAVGTLTRSASNGVALYEDFSITKVGSYALTASASDLTGATTPSFDVRPGPAAQIMIVSGAGQSGAANAPLPRAVVVNVADRFQNKVSAAGVTVNFSATNGGSASPASAITNSFGQTSTSWTLGGTVGTQWLTAAASGLGSGFASATAAAAPAPSGVGGDLVVIDDVNAWDDNYGLSKSGSTFVHPGNAQFVQNVFAFSISGARAAANKVLVINDRFTGGYMLGDYNWVNFGSMLTAMGLSWTISTDHTPLASIASDVKVVMIHTPGNSFSLSEVNGLKAFAAQGGRILIIGENPAYYSQQALETQLIRDLGSPMTVVGSCSAPGEMVRTSSHALTAGIAASGTGSYYMNCASHHTGHGANDVPLFTDSGDQIVGSVLKVNTTPLTPTDLASLRVRASVAPQQEVVLPARPVGGDRTVAPSRRP